MANYYRQCPHCGGHTKDTSCEICGRHTSSTNETYEGLENTSSVVEQKEQTKTPYIGHIQTMMKEGKGFGKQKQETIVKKSKFVAIISILAIIFPFIIFIFDEYESDTSSGYDNYYDEEYDESDVYNQYAYLVDYLVNVNDTTPLECSVDEEDSSKYYVHNTTPYLYDADIALTTQTGDDTSYIYTGFPLGYTSDYSFSPIKGCKITHQQYQNLNLYNVDVAYEWTYDDEDHFMLYITEDADKTQVETLLKRIYALNVLTSMYYEGEEGHVYINDEYRYDMTFYYEDQSIEIIDLNTNKYWSIKLNITY